jgi:phosphatidylinositol kinase/protein kinase (PI-3  family)
MTVVTAAAEIVTALLNLAEFMEHDDKRLPLDTRTLGALAEKCHAFAKVSLHCTRSPDIILHCDICCNNT